MSDDKKVVVRGGGGFLSTVWIVACAILIVKPESFPQWLMDLCDIVFWIGVALLIVFVIIFVMLIFFYTLLG